MVDNIVIHLQKVVDLVNKIIYNLCFPSYDLINAHGVCYLGSIN